MLSSCSDSATDLPPSLGQAFLNDVEVGGVVEVNTGTDLVFDLSGADDTELSSLSIEISDRFAGEARTSNEPLQLSETLNLTGSSSFAEQALVPLHGSVAAGPYSCQIFLEDEAGQRSSSISWDLRLMNSSQPTVDIMSPAANSIFNPGDTVFLSGSASDNRELTSILVNIVPQFPEGSTSQGSELYNNEVFLSGESPSQFDLANFSAPGSFLIIPSDAAAGPYRVQVIPADDQGNRGFATIDIDVQ